MVENKGNKAASILALNSFGGKYEKKVEQIVTPAAPCKGLREKINVVRSLPIMNEECPKLTFYKIEEDAPGVQTTNIFIAAFITFCARLRLYQHLDHVGRNALYLDTDSIVWWSGQP